MTADKLLIDHPASDITPPASVVVTVCTFNERENIGRLLDAIYAALPASDILVVDDSSPDGTAEVVLQRAQVRPGIHLLSRAEKNGLGAATIAAFREAVRRGYPIVVNLDADFSHPPAVLPKLIAALEHADVAIGSRYVGGGAIRGWPWRRHLMSRCINWYSRLLLGLKQRDCSGAYRAYRAEVLAKLDFDRFRSLGYAFQEEMLYRCAAVGATFAEIPIVFQEREAGYSKINLREVRRALFDLAVISWERKRAGGGGVARPEAS